jgi:general secretion pathway protein N
VIRGRRHRRLWAPTASATGWAESTFAEAAWDRGRRAAQRWAVAGVVVGGVVAAAAFAPASWLAAAVADATGQRVLLAEARGTVWSGSAVAVLTGGSGSRDASALPGRLEWDVGLAGAALELRLRHACCINGRQVLQLRPGLGRISASLPASPDWIGQWPTAWLTGLGTPWNTLDLGGALRLSSSAGLAIESVQGRWRISGAADVDLLGVSSRLVPLPTLGNYRLSLAQDGSGNAVVSLATQEGALQLSGSGSLGVTGVRFRGEARATPGQEAVLNNLLNIIGRRDGARSVISIG